MSRPRNLLVSNEGVVFSVSPSKFKEFLAAKAAGTTLPSLGKAVGSIDTDVTGLTATSAASLLATMSATTTADVA